MNEETTIKGYIEDVIFTNEENGYSVFRLEYENSKITCVGIIPNVRPGEMVELTGFWVTHKKFGKQFGFNQVERKLPSSEDALVKYLSSGFIKGIGEKTAIKIIDHFKDQTSYILENEPFRLAEIKGITQEKALKVGDAIKEQKSLGAVILFFSKYGISSNDALNAYKVLGEESLDLIKRNPYRLCSEFIGIGFKQADKIAAGEQLEREAPERIMSGVLYVLQRWALNGNTYMMYDELIGHSSGFLKVSEQLIIDEVIECFNNGLLINLNDRVYLSKFYQAEKYVADKAISLDKIDFSYNKDIAESSFESVIEKLHITLDDIQKEAVKTSLYKGISIISGGPGTGKTTIIKVLIDTLFMMGVKFSLAAPTGRAAKKMEQYSVFKAKTIHRLLEVDVLSSDRESVFLRNEHNPLDCDVLIVDEVSMVDILLMQSLLKALPPGGRIVLLGDSNQLPAIGPGLVLKDMINSDMVPFTLLTKIYRQDSFSKIPELSRDIINGIIPKEYETNEEIHIVSTENDQEGMEKIENIYKSQLEDKRDAQIISPSKKGWLGTISINKYMQEKINKQEVMKNEKIFMNRIFREGDKVMQIRNNYDLHYKSFSEEGYGIYNGDIGVIRTINNSDSYMNVVFDSEKVVTYEFNELDQLELSYCITVHKSQGSEYDCVIIPLYHAHDNLLNRNLLYTAITRAKKYIYLVGDKSIITRMIENEQIDKRCSGLLEMLRI